MKHTAFTLFTICILSMGLSSCVSTQKQLTDASLNGDTQKVLSIVKKKGNVDERLENSTTSLMLAAMACHTETIETLLENGADIEAKDNFGRTPLVFSLLGGNTNCVNMLLEKGANINSKDNYERTAHLMASQTPHFFKTSKVLDSHNDLIVMTFDENIHDFQDKWKKHTIFKTHDWEKPSVSESRPFYRSKVNDFNVLMLGEHQGKAYWASISLTSYHPLFFIIFSNEIARMISFTNPLLNKAEINQIINDLKLSGVNPDMSKRIYFVVVKDIVYSVEVNLREGAIFNFSIFPLQKKG